MRENNHRLSVQQPDGSWQPLRGVRSVGLTPAPVSPGRITGAGRRLVEWLGKLGPRRHLLGLEPAPYRPNAQARARARRRHRHMVQASRRANR